MTATVAEALLCLLVTIHLGVQTVEKHVWRRGPKQTSCFLKEANADHTCACPKNEATVYTGSLRCISGGNHTLVRVCQLEPYILPSGIARFMVFKLLLRLCLAGQISQQRPTLWQRAQACS